MAKESSSKVQIVICINRTKHIKLKHQISPCLLHFPLLIQKTVRRVLNQKQTTFKKCKPVFYVLIIGSVSEF